MTSLRDRLVRRPLRLALVTVLVGGTLGFSAVSTNALGAADRFERLVARIEVFLDPPPHRPTVPTVVVTPRPETATVSRPLPHRDDGLVGAAAEPVRRTPAPVRQAVDFTIVDDHQAVFATEQTDVMCAPAGVQMALAILGLGNTSPEFQWEIHNRIGEWESWEDSHDGGWGPAAVVKALEAYGADGYEIHAYATVDEAVHASAVALAETRKPVVWFPWWGAHTWVMTGFRADADPTVFPDARVSGAYILDPWYPRFSTIWGQSDAPGNFEDMAELYRNWPQGTARDGWSRPEGAYPDRDGRFIVVIPTTPLTS